MDWRDFSLCPRGESNLYFEIRNLASYPLDDGGSPFILQPDAVNENIQQVLFILALGEFLP